MELFREMHLRGIVADTVTYSTLIHGFYQVGDLHGALEKLQEMKSSGVAPDTLTLRSILAGLCSTEELPKAEAMLVDLQKSVDGE
ncbi:unnamed protein product [Microthlaspi erraticum]|uniref:Pentacotripeptide-repeat region of PRORP domain-containing protein n=1 Tax=Microthlaspi erraticum TaxID=1685480 RepID=A0A6D2JP19_9BRAS|nr:unnamed protein product [Microthlaspi erraticum]